MARGVLFPEVLKALVVLALVHQTCSTVEDPRHCAPSSCGSIRNISYPFRLTNDPADCGDLRYSLSCENHQTVLYLYAGRYYVQEINYSNYTIRIVDAGVMKDNHSFIPRYFLDRNNFSSGDPYHPNLYVSPSESLILPGNVVFVKCEKPVNSSEYLDISTCFKDGVDSSNSSSFPSKRYRYVLFLEPSVGDIEDSCQGEQMSLTSRQGPYEDPEKVSCTDVHDGLEYGFLLSWLRVKCGNSCGRRDTCYLDGANNIRCYTSNRFLDRLYDVYFDVQDKLVSMIIRTRFTDEMLQALVYNKDPPIGLLAIMVINVGQYVAAKAALGAPFVIAFLIHKWRRRHLSMYNDIEEFLESHNDLMPIRYFYSEIRKMTNNFSDKLGEGGYGTVFKGTLRSGRLVAIKVLGKSKGSGQDFISEVATIGRIHHVNVVQLIGFCVEGSKTALVYEFMPRGSLNKYIFLQEGSVSLSYKVMHDIALGVARGIEYLHQGCDMQILHFDIKPHNILLDENFTPKVSDFGLAKLYTLEQSSVSLTAVRGTIGYMAPELFYRNIGGVSYKADIYSFGMLLLEMASRRKNFSDLENHSSQVYFPTWIYVQLHDGKDIVIEDATQEEIEIAKKMIIVALWCIQMKPSDRPSMNKVVEMLEGEVEHLQMPLKPFLSSLDQGPTEDIEDSTSETHQFNQAVK